MTTGPENPIVDSESGVQGSPVGRLVEDPAKVVRIGTSVMRLLDEVRDGPLDDDAKARLAQIHERSVEELQDSLASGPAEELQRLWQPLTTEAAASEEELRIGQAQLSGWIGGLVKDIQAAITAKQAATRELLAPLHGLSAVPPGVVLPAAMMDDGVPGQRGQREPNPGNDVEPPGQYL